MNEWLNEWMNEWLNEWNDVQIDDRVVYHFDQTDEKIITTANDMIDEWMNEWMNDWMFEWMHE